jgi:hypothetical protein
VQAFVNDLERPVGTYIYGRRHEVMLAWAGLDLADQPPYIRNENVRLHKELTEAGRYWAVIDRTYPLEAIVEATRYVPSPSLAHGRLAASTLCKPERPNRL